MTTLAPPGLPAFLAAVAARIGREHVLASAETLAAYGEHTLPGGDTPPSAVLHPGSTDEVQAIVRLANTHRVPLYPISTGQNIGLGTRAPVRAGQVIVELGRRMNRIVEVNETFGYCVVEPGVTFQALYDELVRRGNRLMVSVTGGPPLGSVLGNALDKGGGSGAAGDHFGSVCGMEIVLGSGEIIRTGDGSLDTPEPVNWHVSKYSFGPALDGLFTQSNYGIVTRAGVWLQPRPPAIGSFAFTFPDDDDLADIIELVRPLRVSNFVPTQIRVTNDLYMLSPQETHPEYAATGGKAALSDAARKAMQARHGLGAWTVSGALYGASAEALAPGLERLKAHFGRHGKARHIPPEQAAAMKPLHVALATHSGVPGAGELTMLRWRPGGGAIWFTPGTPMSGAIAGELSRACRAICAAHGLEYMVSNVCGPRFARGVHAIIYNRQDADESRRADACYRAMAQAFAGKGIFVGRAPTAYQGFHHAQRMPAFIRACEAIKAALDPNGVIAPGKYGIE